MTNGLPAKISTERENLLRNIYNNIDREIELLLSGKKPVDTMRVVLQGRRAQLRSAEISLAQARLLMQNTNGNERRRK